jgi:hypothetical protein
MKTKPTKIDRSGAKWLPGAMALAATTAGSQAAIVQITLSGNKISSLGGNQLSADFTGDGAPDVVIGTLNPPQYASGGAGFNLVTSGGSRGFGAQYLRGNFLAKAAFSTIAAVGGIGTWHVGLSALSVKALNAITFTDSQINGGAATDGWFEVHAFNESSTSHTVQLTRLIFDDGSTTRPVFTEIPGVLPLWQVAAVPEPSGFLATSLLLGAAGLIRRRQAKAA